MAKELLHRPGSGRVLWSGRDRVLVKLEPSSSAGAFGLVEYELMPGSGPGQHAHEDCHETYYVLEGELAFRLGRDNHVLTQGSLLHVPPGVVHGFRNETEAVVRLLWLFSPGMYVEKMGWQQFQQ